MDKNLKLCSGAEAVQKFQRAGWSAVRRKGSHVMLTKPGYQWSLSIPQHRELGSGLLRKLTRQADLTGEYVFNTLPLVTSAVSASSAVSQKTLATNPAL